MLVYQNLLLMAEMMHELIGSLSHYLQGFMHPRWCRISSIDSTVATFRGSSHFEVYRVGHELENSILVGEFAIEQILAFVFRFFGESVGYV